MKKIALSLILVFTTFTLVLSTYFLWQDADFSVVMPIEEEDIAKDASISFKAVFASNHLIFELLSYVKTRALANVNVEKNYEAVCLKSPFSPPDVM